MTDSPATRPPRLPRRDVHGVLLLDKPLGLSSNDALVRAKRMLRANKAGHTGTLDPLATGLLPLCFGEATKFSQDLLEADKTYEAVVRLGVTTTTGDAEGEVVAERPVTCDRAALDLAVLRFTGPIEQVPPMYSALKKDGKPLYEYARAGQTIERAARAVTIHAIELLDVAIDANPPQFTMRVRCSKASTGASMVGRISSDCWSICSSVTAPSSVRSPTAVRRKAVRWPPQPSASPMSSPSVRM